jgi:small subunit ribosomal protein S21
VVCGEGELLSNPVVFRVSSNLALAGGLCMGLKMRLHDKEPISAALRRFKKLIERSGMKRELKAHEYYEKPCEVRRRKEAARMRAIRKAQQAAKK